MCEECGRWGGCSCCEICFSALFLFLLVNDSEWLEELWEFEYMEFEEYELEDAGNSEHCASHEQRNASL